MQTFEKTSTEVLDYVVNWATYLSADTIATSSFAVTTGITISSQSNATTTATVFISGGTSAVAYTVTNTITTAGGRTAVRSFIIHIIDAR